MTMQNFEVNGKEYELKFNFAAVKHVSSLYEGGALAFIGRALSGDLGTFAHIVHAGLFHTGENFSLKTVEDAIEKQFEEEKVDMHTVLKVSNEVVIESHFFKRTIENMMKKDPKAFELLKEITA